MFVNGCKKSKENRNVCPKEIPHTKGTKYKIAKA